MRAIFIRTDTCPICQGPIQVWNIDDRFIGNHNGYDHTDRNIMVRECAAAKKAQEEVK